MANTTNNPNGRPKGIGNRLTNRHREFFQLLLEENTDRLKTELATLTGKDFIQSMLQMAEFTIPKLSKLDPLALIEDGNKQYDTSNLTIDELENYNTIIEKLELQKFIAPDKSEINNALDYPANYFKKN
jgi:hypothetical protein